MQRPIFPFPAREHRYLESAVLLPNVNQPTAVSVVSTIMSSGRHAADWPQSPSEFPDLTPQPTGAEKKSVGGYGTSAAVRTRGIII
jgi:hypothetical protein